MYMKPDTLVLGGFITCLLPVQAIIPTHSPLRGLHATKVQ